MDLAPRNRSLALIYAATIFVSAFLLFQIQPLVSKAILPWFGGTPAVWTTCLLFFQSLLFAGYAYAHISNSWLRPRRQALVHIGVIVAALLLLGVLPNASRQPRGDADPTWQILVILSGAVGLPYFVLSATGPLLQAWFARSFPDRTPYRLYALSNVGSLLALLSYPFVFERLFDLPWQAWLWSAGFIAFGLLCGYAAWRVGFTGPSPFGRGQGEASSSDDSPSPQPSHRHGESSTGGSGSSPALRDYFLWLLLPAFASVVLMATTNHVSTDIAVVPLLWVVPLSLYLVTFIIAFDRPAWYRPTLIAAPTLVLIYVTSFYFYAINKNGVGQVDLFDCGMTGRCARMIAYFFGVKLFGTDPAATPAGPQVYVGFLADLIINFATMFGICMLCHGELARRRPATRYLTAYYLMIAAGGALGGIAVSLIAPHAFTTVFEWKLAMFAAAIAAITLILRVFVNEAVPVDVDPSPSERSSLVPKLLLVALLLPTSLVLLDLVEYLHTPKKGIVFQNRNFFGTLTIRERDSDNPATRSLLLLNGNTIHGSQYMSPELRGQPTSYYGTPSGIGHVLNFFRANPPPGGIRIGDVGLGAGTLAAYVTKGDYITFYEINPAVIEMSTSGQWFTYVADCRARGANCDIKLGDARLTLDREVQAGGFVPYHVLVLDAFSGDAVPTHLLTAEAMEIYLPRLASAARDTVDGALVVHVSNRYLDLERVVRGVADRFGLDFVAIHSQGVPAHSLNSADWIVLSRNAALMAALAPHASDSPSISKPPVLWTDAHSSLFEILR